MTASILARVSSLTKGDWLMTRETVFFDTFARRAMSLMVARRPTILSGTLSAGVSGGSPLALDVFVLGIGSQCTGATGLDKIGWAPLNDTGFPREAVRSVIFPR